MLGTAVAQVTSYKFPASIQWGYFPGAPTYMSTLTTCGATSRDPNVNPIKQVCIATGPYGEYMGGMSITYKDGCKFGERSALSGVPSSAAPGLLRR
jgi:hypothetical protein